MTSLAPPYSLQTVYCQQDVITPRLGIDPIFEAHLLWIAEESLTAPLPAGWAEHWNAEQGRCYYSRTDGAAATQWESPLDDVCRGMAERARKGEAVSPLTLAADAPPGGAGPQQPATGAKAGAAGPPGFDVAFDMNRSSYDAAAAAASPAEAAAASPGRGSEEVPEEEGLSSGDEAAYPDAEASAAAKK